METTRKPSPRLLLAVLAAIAVAATFWTASALAGGGSSPSSDPTIVNPTVYVQTEDPNAVPGENCPDGSGGAGDGSGSSSDATDL